MTRRSRSGGSSPSSIGSRRWLRSSCNDRLETSYADFVDAMDDDLGTPAAVAVIHDQVARGQQPSGCRRAGGRRRRVGAGDARRTRPRPRRPGLGRAGRLGRRQALGRRRRAGRRAARGARRRAGGQDWARADAIRDRIAAAGIAVEDTPDGPKWTLAEQSEEPRDAREQPAQGRDPEVVEAADGRLGWPGQARARRPGPDPEGGRPAQPQGAQAAGEVRARRGSAPEEPVIRRRRVDRGAERRGRGAAGRRPGERAVRRRGRRARRPAA